MYREERGTSHGVEKRRFIIHSEVAGQATGIEKGFEEVMFGHEYPGAHLYVG